MTNLWVCSADVNFSFVNGRRHIFYLLLRVFLLKKNRNPGSTPDLDPDFSYPFSLPYQLNIDCFSTMQVSNRFLLIAVLFGATVAKPTLTNCLNYIVLGMHDLMIISVDQLFKLTSVWTQVLYQNKNIIPLTETQDWNNEENILLFHC